MMEYRPCRLPICLASRPNLGGFHHGPTCPHKRRETLRGSGPCRAKATASFGVTSYIIVVIGIKNIKSQAGANMYPIIMCFRHDDSISIRLANVPFEVLTTMPCRYD